MATEKKTARPDATDDDVALNKAAVPANKETWDKGTQQEKERIGRLEEFAKNPLANIVSIFTTKHTGTDKELKTALTGLLYALRILATKESGGILQLRASSSAGKTNMANTILSCFPEAWIKRVGDISANALKYIVWQDEKILYIQEAGGTERTTEHLKLMDAGDGGFKAVVTEGTPATGFKAVEYNIPVKFIITTRAEGMFDPQLENRMFCLSIDESVEQTFLILLHRCKAYAGHLKEKSFEAIREFIQSLKIFDEINIPFSYEFLNILEQKKIRVRRDIDKILSLCQTSAFLNQKNRPIYEADDKRILFATPEDAYNVFTLAFPSFEETVTGLSKKLQTVYEAIPDDGSEGITYRELAKKIGWNKRTVTRAVEDQLDDMGLVIINTSSNAHVIYRAEPMEKIIKDFEKYKKNFLVYTAVELCQHLEKCDIPLSWHDINQVINRDIDRDKSVTKFYTKDELQGYFKDKKKITISHFCHGLVTLNVTFSSPYEYVSFKYCDIVTKSTVKDDTMPDITLDISIPRCHGVTPALNDKIRDAIKIINEHPEDNYEVILDKYGQTFIDKNLEQGYFFERISGKQIDKKR